MSVDIIIAQRQYDNQVAENMLFEAIKFGKKVIYEVDDNLHAVLPSSPVFGIYHQGSNALRMVSTIVNRCHGCTVSTHELAGDYSKFNDNIEVLPNSIDFEIRDWKTRPEDKDTEHLIVGWSGGTTHWEDLQLIKKPIIDMLKKYDYVKFGIYTSEQLMRMVVEHWDLDPDRVQFIPPRPFSEYPTGLPYFDIGLAPTVNCRFNAAKSNLKILEYGAWNIPCVASRIPPYATTIRNGKNGFTARSEREWFEAICYLIDNDSERKVIGDTMRTIVDQDFNMDKNIHLWPEAWKRIIERSETNGRNPYPVLWGKVGRNDKCPCGCGKKYKKCTDSYPAWGG